MCVSISVSLHDTYFSVFWSTSHVGFLLFYYPLLHIVFLFCTSCYNVKHCAAAAKSLQSCPTLCDPIDSSPPGTPVPGILQAITLEWVAISSSNAWKWKVKSLSRSVMSDSSRPHGLQPTRLLHPWDFPGKSTGVGCHCLLQKIFPNQGLNSHLLHWQADSFYYWATILWGSPKEY